MHQFVQSAIMFWLRNANIDYQAAINGNGDNQGQHDGAQGLRQEFDWFFTSLKLMAVRLIQEVQVLFHLLYQSVMNSESLLPSMRYVICFVLVVLTVIICWRALLCRECSAKIAADFVAIFRNSISFVFAVLYILVSIPLSIVGNILIVVAIIEASKYGISYYSGERNLT